MEKSLSISVSPQAYFAQFEEMERIISQKEEEIRSLREKIDGGQSTDKKTRRRVVTPETNAYSDFKSDGKRKPHAADSIRSYDDFVAIQNYFLQKDSIRDWAMWTIGVSLGLRISDLLSLRFGSVLDVDKKTFRRRLMIYEQKTGKLNDLLITESVIDAMQRYLDAIKWEFDLDGFLFPSKKTGGKMYEECGWRILSHAGRALNLPIVVGSHTMRKSFANIAACLDKSCVDMNAITKIQGLLNHSDQRVTMRYLGTYQDMFDRARMAVSDFVLGRTGVNEIRAGNMYTTDDVVERLDELERIISEKETH